MKRPRDIPPATSSIRRRNSAMAGYSSKMELKDLPIELKAHILCNIDPGERRHLRLVNKMMLHAVDRSMSDVKKIVVSKSYKHYEVKMKTVHPCTGETGKYCYKIVHSSVFPLLRRVGSLTETIKIYSDDEPHAENVRQVLGTLNVTDACGALKNLCISWTGSVYNSAVVLRYLLEYVTKRRLEAKLAEDELKRPFLQSLALTMYIHPHNEQQNQLLKDQIRILLQLIIDQCDGLKELNIVDENKSEVLSLPTFALRFPTTLTNLEITGLGKTPRELRAVIKNCPNLQFIELDSTLLCKKANVSAIASLSDLRKIAIDDSVKEGESAKSTDPVELIKQCLTAFGEHPFGAAAVNPWPRLSCVFLQCFLDDCIEISALDGVVTSLLLFSYPCYESGWQGEAVHQVLRMLNRTNACPKLKELEITLCPLGFQAANSSILAELLAYFTKRQSQVETGTPFLRSLSLSPFQFCDQQDSFHQAKLSDKLEEMQCMVQKVLNKCHGLEKLVVDELLYVMCWPAVAFHYPRTLTSLETAFLSDDSGELRAITANCPSLKTINKVSVKSLIRASTR